MRIVKTLQAEKRKQRESGIELLKIIGILLVVISHVTQTLFEPIPSMNPSSYLMNIGASTTNVQQLILTVFSYSGVLGNAIFFACSAWFLLDSKKFSKTKVLRLLLEIWTVSAAILIVFLALGYRTQLSGSQILKCLLPTTFSLNWYLTCYLLFYIAHPWINAAIGKMGQRVLLRCAVLLFLLYSVMNFVFGAFFEPLFFTSTLILWLAIYFVIAYSKKYLPEFSANTKKQGILLAIGLLGNLLLIAFTDIVGLKWSFLKDSLRMWSANCNPFLLLAAISSMNLARAMKFRNSFINRVSSLSLLIYIIHENYLLRLFVRPRIFAWIYEKFGYGRILLWMLLVVAAIFIASAIMAFLYQITVERLLQKLINKFYPRISKKINKLENRLMEQK